MSNLYLQRYGWPERLFEADVPGQLELVVVIPVFREKEVLKTLDSLSKCSTEGFTAEVILVLNEAEEADEETRAINSISREEIQSWIQSNDSSPMQWHLAYIQLPKKHAGVGLARKAGMDEAVRRFEQSSFGNQGIILCLDADCTVDPNYLQETRQAFQDPKINGASLYFEHPLQGDHDPEVYRGIIHYELFLRYYRQGLRYVNFPHHYHTVGSSMAVRSNAYQKQGGMNRRKAGEDFYFLHRIMPLGNFAEINTTRVIPSPRPSDRVPFGTGKAINAWLKQEEDQSLSYNPNCFKELKYFFNEQELFYQRKRLDYTRINTTMNDFLQQQEFDFERLLMDSSDYESFLRKFYEWFNGFRVLKFIHFCRDFYYEQIPLLDGANTLLKWMGHPGGTTELELLGKYREIDRKG